MLLLDVDRTEQRSQLLGLGSAQPPHVVTAEDLGRPFGRDAAWVRDRTGIDQVHRMRGGDDITVLAVRAGRTALERADIPADRVDLVITASCSISPHLSDEIARAVSPRAGRMTINAACSGFCYALSTANDFIRIGAARTILVIAIEQMSSLLDPKDLATWIIFGDGAGAAVVGRADSGAGGIGPVLSGSDGARGPLIACRDDGTLSMAGRDVFRWAVETIPELALETCRRAGLELSDLAAFVPHQANKRIIDAVSTRLGLANHLISTDVSRSGNTSGASIPIALDRILTEHPRLSGHYALLLGFGAGLSYAGQVVRLP